MVFEDIVAVLERAFKLGLNISLDKFNANINAILNGN